MSDLPQFGQNAEDSGASNWQFPQVLVVLAAGSGAASAAGGKLKPQFGQNTTAAGTVAWQLGQALVPAMGADMGG